MDRVTYDRVLLMDLYPGPDYPYVTVVSFKKTGIPVDQLETTKLTRELRLAARDLPIYADPGHEHYLVAKLESKCDRTEEARAARSVNDFIHDTLRAGSNLQDIPAQVVDNFKGRVQHLVPYVRKSERGEQRTFKSTSRRPQQISSSDQDITTPRRSLGLSLVVKAKTATRGSQQNTQASMGEGGTGRKVQ